MGTAGKSKDVPLYDWADLSQRKLRDGVHPGMISDGHSQECEQGFILQKGRVTLVGDQVFDCMVGAFIYIPPKIRHQSDPPKPEDGVVLNMDV